MWPLTSITIFAKLFSFSKSKLITVDHCPYLNNYSRDLAISSKKIFSYIRLTYPFAFLNIVVSNSIKYEFEHYAKLNKNKVITIHNGIFYKYEDLIKNNNIRKKLFNLNQNIPCIVSAGNLKPQKNFMNLIKAIEIVIKKICKVIYYWRWTSIQIT